jgi:hypothetical protein
MKASSTTYPATSRDPETERRFRNQATGIGQTRAASESSGAARSQRVADAIPADMRACADDSYPAPIPDGPTALTPPLITKYRLR